MMATTSVSVRTCCALLLFFTLNFSFNENHIEGKWSCDGFSMQLNDFTTLEKQCGGDLNFRSNRKLESTCTAGLFPPGSKWRIANDNLYLSDSDGRQFTSFHIEHLKNSELILTRDNKVYTFGRGQE
jgi:hypothetical protein